MKLVHYAPIIVPDKDRELYIPTGKIKHEGREEDFTLELAELCKAAQKA